MGTSHAAQAWYPSYSSTHSEHLLRGMHDCHVQSPQRTLTQVTIARMLNRTTSLNRHSVPAHDFASEETLKPSSHLDTSHPLLYSLAWGTSHPAQALCKSQQPSYSSTHSEHLLRGMHDCHVQSPQRTLTQVTIARMLNRTTSLNRHSVPAHDFASEETLKPSSHLDTSHPLLYSLAWGTSHPAQALCKSQQPSYSPTST